MVAHRRAVIRHPSEILLVVILGPEFIGSPPLGVVMVPETDTRISGKPKPGSYPPPSSTGSQQRTLPRTQRQTHY